MKKKLLCFVLLSAIALTGGNIVQNENTEVAEKESQSEVSESESQSETESKPEVAKKKIKDVLVKTDVKIPSDINDIKDAPDAELFYEDETYEYYFLKPISADVTICYEDGTSENVKDAFKAGHVELSDFRRGHYFDVFVKAKKTAENPKLVNIAYRSGEWMADQATEVFYTEGKYRYYYTAGISHFICVYYDNGTRENIRKALESGRISIEEAKEYGFGGSRSLNIEKIVDLTVDGDISCVQEREEVYEGIQYRYYFDSVKSQYIEIYYKNGEKETLRELIDSKTLTDTELYWLYGWKIEGLKKEP